MAPPSSRRISQDTWDQHKEIILGLRFDEGLPLKSTENNGRSLMQVMKSDHRFDATAAQYEVQLKRWGAIKNLKRGDWSRILPIYDKLKERGLEPRVKVGDQIFDEKKIKRARREYCRRGGARFNDTAPSSDGTPLWHLEIRQSGGPYTKYSEERSETSIAEANPSSPLTRGGFVLLDVNSQGPPIEEHDTSELLSSWPLRQLNVDHSPLSQESQIPRSATNRSPPNASNFSSSNTGIIISHSLLPSLGYGSDATLVQTDAVIPDLLDDLVFASFDGTPLERRVGETIEHDVSTIHQGELFPHGTISIDLVEKILEMASQALRLNPCHKMEPINPGILFNQLACLPSPNIFDEGFASDFSLLNLGIASKSEPVQRILYSIANNFTGLENVPACVVVSILKMALEIDSSLLENICYATPAISKSLIDNIFLIALEAGEEEVACEILKLTLNKPNKMNVDSMTCTFMGYRYSPMALAAGLNQLELVKALTSYGAKVCRSARSFDECVTHCAIGAMFSRSFLDPTDCFAKEDVNHCTDKTIQIVQLLLDNEPREFAHFLEIDTNNSCPRYQVIKNMFQQIPGERYFEIFQETCTHRKPSLEWFISQMLHWKLEHSFIMDFIFTCCSNGVASYHNVEFINAVNETVKSAIGEGNLSIEEYDALLQGTKPTRDHLKAAIRSERLELTNGIFQRILGERYSENCEDTHTNLTLYLEDIISLMLRHKLERNFVLDFTFTCYSIGIAPNNEAEFRDVVNRVISIAIMERDMSTEEYKNLLRGTQPTQSHLTASIHSGQLELARAILAQGGYSGGTSICIRHLKPQRKRYKFSCKCAPTSPLAEAIRLQNPGLIKLLEEYGALDRVSDIKKSDFEMAAFAALRVGDLTYLKRLVNLVSHKSSEFMSCLGRLVEKATKTKQFDMAFTMMIQYQKAADDVDLMVHDMFKLGCGILRLALERQDSKALENLLEHLGANFFAYYTNEGSDCIAEAIKWGEEDIIKDLIRRGLCPRPLSNSQSQTPLNIAVQNGNIELAVLLLEAGVSPNYEDSEGLPLQVAIEASNMELVALLLSRGADPNLKASFSYKLPLLTAVEHSNMELALLLLNSGAHPGSALYAAIKARKTKFITLLLDRGADPNMLEVAVETGDEDILRLLLDHGADPATESAFLDALKSGISSLFYILLKAFTSQYPAGKRGFSFLVLNYVIRSCDIPLLDDLIKAKFDVNSIQNGSSDPDYRTPLHILVSAIMESNETNIARNKMICSLVAAGADLELPDESGISPFLEAIKSKKFHAVELLLPMVSDLNRPAEKGLIRTPLQQACEAGCFRTAKLLLSKGADVNAPAALSGGGTAIQFAAIRGDVRIVKLLLHQGANVHDPPSIINGRTALEGAAEHGRVSILNVLLTEGGSGYGIEEIESARAKAEKKGHRGCEERLKLAHIRQRSKIELGV